MYSIGELSKEYNLARSTLLYYDAVGLLTASERTPGNYRQYSEEDKKRLDRIRALREAGVPIRQIKNILDTPGTDENNILERRLDELNQEIRYLRFQQRLIVEMLKEKNLSTAKMLFDRESFVTVLKCAGLNEEMRTYFHDQFEENAPDAHQFFLEFLGITEEEIKHIRDLTGPKKSTIKR